VIAIIPTADRSKATVKVRIALKSRDARIVPDMGVRVAFLDQRPAAPERRAPAVLVPADAVRPEGDGGVVFVVTDGRVAARTVALGDTVGADREILRGISAGERIVVAPPPSLADGDRVRLAE
jgi:multidrug efflux pump subunit AcrA (membrane-fusion protein)